MKGWKQKQKMGMKAGNEIVNKNGGLVIFTSTDQAGNFRIGDGIVINQATGSLTGTDFTKALFTTMTPFILALAD